MLGQSGRVDPFHVRQINEDDMVEEVDRSDELLARLKAEKIDALISVVGNQGLTILYKLHTKGLNTVCIPLAVENDIAATLVSFGFNSVLNFTIEMLDKARQGAIAARKIAVVEVLGEQAGWLALQAGIAAGADAILIPEIPCDLQTVAASLKKRMSVRRSYGLVVVAQGAKLNQSPRGKAGETDKEVEQTNLPTARSLKDALSPLATGENSQHVIRQSGQAAGIVANRLQLLMAEETFPLVLGPWARGGAATAVDRQLGLVYGAKAVQAIAAGQKGAMVAYVPPEVEFVPLAQAINRTRTVSMDNEFIEVAESIGICLGRKSS